MSDLRIDRVATMPGAVRDARTYSLVLRGGTLYVIDVGPAMGPPVRARGLIGLVANKLADVMVAKVRTKTDAKVSEGVARLDARGPEAMADEKGSHTFRSDEVRSCAMGTNAWGSNTLKLKTAGQDFAFVPAPGGEADLMAFGEAIGEWAGV